jgi:hypothetical protein
MRPLLVGEANPYSPNPRLALYPYPPHSAGACLRRLLGMTHHEYMAAFDRVNLFTHPPAKWSALSAREAALEVQRKRDNEVVILLGRRVAKAFDFDLEWWSHQEFGRARDGKSVTLVLAPHPSGRCREWNNPRSCVRLRKIVGRYLHEPASW